jgi:FtsP/CotA-like multicopper oxidase with cupredoxin domain
MRLDGLYLLIFGKQHGYSFYVLDIYESTTGWGSYNPFVDGQPPSMTSKTVHDDLSVDPYDYSTAIFRDTVQIPRRGYAVLRFRADNRGLWLFHCHILWHLAGGMAMIIDVMDHTRMTSDLPIIDHGLECRMK